ncbi:hypothetical protein [Streptomyces sp. NRRL S-448]|uniref:immunity protein TriTu family protein n=1 Tax=Streptomyces sp. NRRL S-448 TaxID=1463907 RepID=UPI000A824C83
MLTGSDLLESLKSWVAANASQLRENGFDVDLTESPEDYDPRSVRLILEADERLGELALWSNGTAELHLAEVASGDVVREHREITSHADLASSLKALTNRMTA